LNTFVIFLSRVIGYLIDRLILKNENDAPGMGYWVSVIVLDIVLGFLAAIIVAGSRANVSSAPTQPLQT